MMAAVPIVTANKPSPPPLRRTSVTQANTSTLRRTSQHSVFAKNVLMNKINFPASEHAPHLSDEQQQPRPASAQPSIPSVPSVPSAAAAARKLPLSKDSAPHADLKSLPYVTAATHHGLSVTKDGVGAALSDTPVPSAPGSPKV
jgi:6-phosphofructo-2-kinase